MRSNSNQQGQSNGGSYPMMGNEYMAGQQFYPQQQQQQPIQLQQYPSGGPPMMFPPGMQQTHGMQSGGQSFQPPQQQQQQFHLSQQPSGQLPATGPSYGAGQYFIDAACTVPAGQLAQQPQLLHQMPQAGQLPFPPAGTATTTTTTTRACSNPNCKHCGFNGGAAAGKPNSRR